MCNTTERERQHYSGAALDTISRERQAIEDLRLTVRQLEQERNAALMERNEAYQVIARIRSVTIAGNCESDIERLAIIKRMAMPQ